MDSSPILDEQLAYYRAGANEYGKHPLDVPGQEELLAAIEAFRPTGDVLELACGAGVWTEQLLPTAATVTAVDAAPEMLARAKARVTSGAVRFVEADLFSWRPGRRYDAIFFGFWLSHVPDERFESFWSLVAEGLAPGGQVFYFDDNHRPEIELVEGATSPIVERSLSDGSTYRIVKIPYRPAQLEDRLRALGWEATVTPTTGPFYWGTATR